MDVNDVKRYSITLTGIVQGVGFRPFVYRMAMLQEIKGWVENQGSKVVMEVEGNDKNIKEFLYILQNNHPPNAKIVNLNINQKSFLGYDNFSIRASRTEINTANFLPCDVAVCKSCIKEFNASGDKRFQYSFISCTNCGPRYSIINSLPYDRKNTAMSEFEMCPQCLAEYRSPSDRRYHAQTNCCSHCGPVLKLLNAHGSTVNTPTPAKMASELISQGKILAVKGIGGYHLCCNAQIPEAIQRLRKLKGRPHKPLAIMARNIDAVQRICQVSEKEEEILIGTKKPILLLKKLIPEYLPQNIAPNQKRLGVMLAYAPLHLLLFSDHTDYLIMTSGNVSGLPIYYKESDAINSLGDVADYFLTHNRDITVPVDDAVVKVADNCEMLVRCGRGYAPLTIPIDSEKAILAVGAEQKSTICITWEGFATVSQYIGDLKTHQTYHVFTRQIEHFEHLFQFHSNIIAHDLNPDYLSTRYAKEQTEQKVAVQHHHAHMAGCMAENKLANNVIGVIYDGTGLGTDGAVWGGEFFVGSLSEFKRAGHLKYVMLQGGDSVVKQPWRCAASYLLALGIEPCEYLHQIDSAVLDIVTGAIRNSIRCFESSSMGRLFDCVAALCGFQNEITYDAQAAIELENLSDADVRDFYHYRISESKDDLILEYDDIIKAILGDIQSQVLKSKIAAKFHNTVIAATAECACKIRYNTGLNDVVLSGGVFENVSLLEGLIERLQAFNFNVYYNRLLPTNDGGISFGQAVAAGAILKEKDHVPCYSC